MYKTDKHPHREQVSGSSSSEKFRHISSDILTYKTFTISRSTNQNAHHHPPDKLLNPPLAGAFAACGSGVAALRVFSSSMATSSSPHPSQAEAVALSLTSFACACAFTGAGATGTDRLRLAASFPTSPSTCPYQAPRYSMRYRRTKVSCGVFGSVSSEPPLQYRRTKRS